MAQTSIHLDTVDLAQNLAGNISPSQRKRLQRYRLMMLSGVVGFLGAIGLIIAAAVNRFYIMWLPAIYWLWLLRHMFRNWRRATLDLQAGRVATVEGSVRCDIDLSPGIFRIARHRLAVNDMVFRVDKDIYYQFQPRDTYRIYYAVQTKLFLGAIATAVVQADTSVSPAPEILEQFNQRELEILQLMAAGLSNKEIAQQLHLSVNTIKMYASQIYRKLDVRRRTEAVVAARKLGLL